MKKLFLTAIFLLFFGSAWATPVTVDGVPSYTWLGCSPSAAGMIAGYWDMNGYDNLFDASGDDVFLTSNVQDQINAPGAPVIGDYSSIADYMGTNSSGGTYINRIAGGIRNYVSYRGYDDWSVNNTTRDWDFFTAEIDAGRPMLFNVDTRGTGRVNHSITAFAYDLETMMYGFYSTWRESEEIWWQPFRAMSSSYSWGISNMIYVRPGEPDPYNPVPEPSTIMLFGIGLLGIAWRKKT